MRGYAFVSIEYRLTGSIYHESEGNEQAKFDALEDLRAAIRWTRKNAEKYHFDTDKIIASGSSAGAATTLFLGYAKEA